MALTMSDYIERRGLGQDVRPEDVNLGFNDLARLSRIQSLDPTKSAYSGQGIQAAQEIASELPTAADLGLMVEQNKQLAAAGGRGYAGNVHNLQGQQTPFQQLTQQIAQARSDLPYDNSRVAPEFVRDGNGGEGGGYSRDMDPLGHFGQEAFRDVTRDVGIKGLTSAGLAYGIGAPLGAAAKFGLSSMFGPLGALMGMGKLAYGGMLDMATGQMANDSMVGDVNSSMDATGNGMGPTNEAAARMGMSPQAQAAQQLGIGYGGKYGLGQYGPYDLGPTAEQQAVTDIENMGIVDQVSAAINAAIRGPEGGWTASTDIDPVSGVHKGTLANDPMGISQAMGLESSYGDPFGIGLGGSGNGGSGNGGGRSGGGMSDAGGFGTGDRGDREGGGWV